MLSARVAAAAAASLARHLMSPTATTAAAVAPVAVALHQRALSGSGSASKNSSGSGDSDNIGPTPMSPANVDRDPHKAAFDPQPPARDAPITGPPPARATAPRADGGGNDGARNAGGRSVDAAQRTADALPNPANARKQGAFDAYEATTRAAREGRARPEPPHTNDPYDVKSVRQGVGGGDGGVGGRRSVLPDDMVDLVGALLFGGGGCDEKSGREALAQAPHRWSW